MLGAKALRHGKRESTNRSPSPAELVHAGFIRINGAARRAVSHAGYERDAGMLVVKSLVAATGAWAIANVALMLPSPAFAPFTAVLMVQATVYRSLRQSLQYVVAVILGVGIEGGLGFALGPSIGTFVAIALLTLLIARWRQLEDQSSQVTTAAFFAYATFITTTSPSQRLTELAGIVLLVLIGAGSAVVTNLLYPPLHYRSVAQSIDRLTTSLADLLGDVRSTLEAAAPNAHEAEDWLYRARQLEDSVGQARESITRAEESVLLNPRRLFGAHPTSFTGYRIVIDALERAGEQLRAITRGLAHVPGYEQDHTDGPHERFLSSCGQLLAAAAEAVRDLGYVDQLRSYGDVDALKKHIRTGQEHYQQLSRQMRDNELDAPGQWPLYGGLLVDAHRLIEEFDNARKRLTDEHSR